MKSFFFLILFLLIPGVCLAGYSSSFSLVYTDDGIRVLTPSSAVATNDNWTSDDDFSSDTTAPTLSSATISANGITITFVFDEAVTQGTGYNDSDFDIDCSVLGDGVSITYSSGDGTDTHVYAISSTVGLGETVDVDFNGDADSVEDNSGNDLAAISSTSVTNNSTYTSPSYYYAITDDGIIIATPSGAIATNDNWTFEPGVVEIGSITLTITPSGAVSESAQWSIDSGSTWNNSGVTVSNLVYDDYTVTYKETTSYPAPADETVTVDGDETPSKEFALPETIFIDADAVSNGTGTESSPYNTWDSVTFKPGGTYYQRSGTTWNERLNISVTGTVLHPVVIDIYDGTAKAIIDGEHTESNGTRGLSVWATYLTISNFDVKQMYGNGLAVIGGNNIDFYNCISQDNNTLVSGNTANGLSINNRIYDVETAITDVNFYDCTFDSNAAHGAYVSENVNTVLFDGCTFSNNGQLRSAQGVSTRQYLVEWEGDGSNDLAWTNTSGTIYRHALLGNPSSSKDFELTVDRIVVFENPDYVELTYDAGDYASLVNGEYDIYDGEVYVNTGADPTGDTIKVIADALYSIIFIDCIMSGNKSPNIVYGGEGTGVCFDEFINDSYILRCKIYDNEGSGIYILGGVGNTVAYNEIYNNGGAGIRNLSASKNNLIYNNTIQYNGYSTDYESRNGSHDGLMLILNDQGTIFKNNIITNNKYYGVSVDAYSGTETYDYNNVYGNGSGNTYQGTNGINQDPLFRHTGENDYSIRPGSPCVDAGDEITGLHDDVDFGGDINGFIYRNSNPSIGAYEFDDVADGLMQ